MARWRAASTAKGPDAYCGIYDDDARCAGDDDVVAPAAEDNRLLFDLLLLPFEREGVFCCLGGEFARYARYGSVTVMASSLHPTKLLCGCCSLLQ